MSDTRARARAILADAFELSAEKVEDNASIETLDAWTSLGHLRLILAIEAELGGQLDAAAVVEIESLADVVSVLDSQGNR
jgi:acyl carrier protein